MTDSKTANKTNRELRLRSALRENLKRRKVQARERAVEDAPGDSANRAPEVAGPGAMDLEATDKS